MNILMLAFLNHLQHHVSLDHREELMNNNNVTGVSHTLIMVKEDTSGSYLFSLLNVIVLSLIGSTNKHDLELACSVPTQHIKLTGPYNISP